MTEEHLQSTDTYAPSLIRSSTEEHKGFNIPEASSHLHWHLSQRTLDNDNLTQLVDAYQQLIKLADWFQIKKKKNSSLNYVTCTKLHGKPKWRISGISFSSHWGKKKNPVDKNKSINIKNKCINSKPQCGGQIWIILECLYQSAL